MTLESELSIFYIASIFSIIDISLTYYILWYDRKINPIPKFRELNPVAKRIMRWTNNGPWGLVISGIFTQALIWGIGMGVGMVDPIKAVALINFLAGAIFVAVWIHTYSIRGLHKANNARKTIKEVIG
jgi:hypothetical protein